MFPVGTLLFPLAKTQEKTHDVCGRSCLYCDSCLFQLLLSISALAAPVLLLGAVGLPLVQLLVVI